MKKTGKKDMTKFLFNVGKASAGGILAELASDYIAKNSPDLVANNPKVTELIPIAGGAAIVYFMGEEWAPAGYGMIGAGSAGFADDIVGAMQGFSRVNYMNGAKADEYRRGIEIIEKMQGVGFDEAEIISESQEDEDENDMQ